MKIYLAMAEMADGSRMFERAYLSEAEAQAAAEAMITDVHGGTNWELTPIVEETELVLNEETASMGELADPADLKSAADRRTGSIPVTRTKGPQ